MPFDLEDWLAVAPPSSPIVRAGATILRRVASDVTPSVLSTSAFSRLIEVMVETMRAAPGVGLAAPQIGVPLRVFVAEDTEDRMSHQSVEARALRGRASLALTILVNPTVVPASRDEATFYEGCLSVPGYGALVRRSAAVEVTGIDVNGRAVCLHFDGWPARIMQHEMDHLKGTLYVDRMIPRSLAADGELGRLSSLSVGDILRELALGDSPRAQSE